MANGVDYPFQTLNQLALVTGVNNTSVLISAANENRRAVYIRNNGSRVLHIGLTSPVTEANAFIEIPAETTWKMAAPEVVWSGALYGIRAAGLGAQDVVTTDFMF